MDNLFYEWMVEKKLLTVRSAKDVVCRKNRVLKILNESEINEKTLERLVNNRNFQPLSRNVKSQLKRSIKLCIEFKLSTEKGI